MRLAGLVAVLAACAVLLAVPAARAVRTNIAALVLLHGGDERLTDLEWAYFRATRAIRAGRSHDAEAELRRARLGHRGPEDYLLIKLLMDRGAWADVARLFETGVGDLLTLRHLAERRVFSSEGEEARCWRAALRSREPGRLIVFARSLFASRRYDAAGEWAASVVEPGDFEEAQRILGASLFYRQRFAEAVEVLRPNTVRTAVIAEDWYWLGRALLYDGRAAEAVLPLERAAAATPAETRGWVLKELSSAYLVQRRCQDALRAITAVTTALVPGSELDRVVREQQAAVAAECRQGAGS
jgi:tetratricopeptide (TPR) repeat protein